VNVIDPETTLADVVTNHPDLARELERRGLDYCCHGGRSLTEACRAAGLDPDAVATELGTAADPTGPEPWAGLGPAELVDHLESVHHRYLHSELPRLGALVDKVVEVHGARHPELAEVGRRFAELRAGLEPHLMKEELALFPAIRHLAQATTRPVLPFGSIANPISMMRGDHDRDGEVLARLRVVTNDYRVPEDGCASYRALYDGLARLEADTHLHIHKENNVLFPAVLRLEDELRVGEHEDSP